MNEFNEITKLNKRIKQIEMKWIKKALSMTKWNKAQAARILSMKRTTLVMKCKKYGLMTPQTIGGPVSNRKVSV